MCNNKYSNVRMLKNSKNCLSIYTTLSYLDISYKDIKSNYKSLVGSNYENSFMPILNTCNKNFFNYGSIMICKK